MQTKNEIENWYEKKDPWGYETNEWDKKRKDKIMQVLSSFGTFERALDIGAGEGWVTKDLPAKQIEAIELSDSAASRFPDNVKRVHEPTGKYDFIVATGVFYLQYDWEKMHEWVKNHASKIVLTSHIMSWEIPLVGMNQIDTIEFPYREYTQKLRVYDVSIP